MAREHLARLVQIDEHAHGETINAGAQRADVVAEALGQHGQHAVNEVGGAGTGTSLEVDRGAPAHVMRDIGDVHAQAKARLRTLARHGVIEVLGGVRVDRHAQKAAKVLTPRLRREHAGRVVGNTCRLLKRRLAKADGQPMARDDALDGQVEPLGTAHASLDRDHAGFVAARVGEDASLHHVALGNAQTLGALVVGQDEEVAADALVERNDRAQGPGNLEGPHKPLAGAAKHALHHSLRLARSTVHQHDRCLVAVHALAQAAAGHQEGALGRLDRGRARTRHVQRAR